MEKLYKERDRSYIAFKKAIVSLGWDLICNTPGRSYSLRDNRGIMTNYLLEKNKYDLVYRMYLLKERLCIAEESEKIATFTIDEINILTNGTVRIGGDDGFTILKKA